jgi:hypothetical protein
MGRNGAERLTRRQPFFIVGTGKPPFALCGKANCEATTSAGSATFLQLQIPKTNQGAAKIPRLRRWERSAAVLRSCEK